MSIPEVIQLSFDVDSPHLCECGCGRPTRKAKRTVERWGIKRGEYLRFLHQHNIGRTRKERLPAASLVERFWAKVRKGNGPDACWVWTASLNEGGYGFFTLSGRHVFAHRYSYELHFGPIPEGLLVCHKCDVRNCIRPDHLFLGTHDDNSKDAMRKHRMAAGERHMSRTHPELLNRGEKAYNAKMTETGVRELRLLRAQGLTYRELGKRFGITPDSAWKIATYKSWAHIR